MLKNFTVVFLLILPILAEGQWQSSRVYYNTRQHLEYSTDNEHNRIPDFSYAGYKNGIEAIPDIPVIKTIGPVNGDNTAHINNAIFEVALQPTDANGFHGALLLEAGLYEIKGTIKIPSDGIIVRGVGQEADTSQNTVLWATGDTPHQRTVLVAGGGDHSEWAERVWATTSDIVSDSLFVGERSFEVADASLYAIGDNIIIKHPCTSDWLTAIDFGGTHSDMPDAVPGVDVPWKVNSQPILYNRYITAIVGNRITIDAPLFNALIRSQSQSYVYTCRRDGIKKDIGIENLRIDIQAASETDENHAWNALDLYVVEDVWVRDCSFLHFGLSGVRTNTATRVTVERCSALDPKSVIEGGKRYNFNAYAASQLILFKDCFARNGRHHYISNGKSLTSGIVFLDCTSSGAYTSSEGHRQWSQGLLYDNHTELDGPRAGLNPRLLGLYNRGYYGTSHGWPAVNSVAWNCDVAEGNLIVQKPPTAQNYAIGCSGANITGVKPPASFDEPQGFIEGSNTAGLEPRSLYLAQLEERKTLNALEEPQSRACVPQNAELLPNYPNPFNPQTTIPMRVNRAGAYTMQIVTLQGQVVRLLQQGRLSAGMYHFHWDGLNDHGRSVASGVYFIQLRSKNFFDFHKLIKLQ